MSKCTESMLIEEFSYCSVTGHLFRNGKKVGTKSSGGYLKVTFMGVEYLAHRLCWFLHHDEWPNVIDHINHDKCDNRILNIRNVDHKANNMNQSLRSDNKSGVSGVYWCKAKERWRSQIRVNGKKTNLGTFSTIIDAAIAVIKATKKHGYHENHGKVNF